MKAHVLAKSLRLLADILESNPNIELSKNLIISDEYKLESSEVAVSLQALIKLSKFQKQDWIKFINENNFNIEIRNAYSSRDILGKLLKYLDKNPEAIDSMKKKSIRNRNGDSPLMKALDLLVTGEENERTNK